MNRINFLRATILGVVVVLIAGCEPRPPLYGQVLLRESMSFAWGLEEVSELYVVEKGVEQVMLDGLNGLSALDPRIDFAYSDGEMVLRLDERSVKSIITIHELTSIDDGKWLSRGWIMSSAVDSARAVSDRVGSARKQKVLDAVFTGMVSNLDGSSRYWSPDQLEEISSKRSEEDGYIAIRFRMVEEGAKVVYVQPEIVVGTGGLVESDVILSIDGQKLAGLTNAEVWELLLGPLGSKVNLAFRRALTGERLTTTIVRRRLPMPSVNYHWVDGVVWLRFYSFYDGMAEEVSDTIASVHAELGRKVRGVVLDLRGNTGGTLSSSVALADLFIDSGLIAVIHGRHPASHQYFRAEVGQLFDSIPMVVVIDEGTSAGGELVAAALQDRDRAVVIGSASNGQGAIQTLLVTPNDGRLKLTWAQMFAPSGYTLQARGVLPNLCMANSTNVSEIIEQARDSSRLLPRDFRTQQIDPNNRSAVSMFRAQCEDEESYSVLMYEVAMQLFEEPSLYARALGQDLQ